MNNAFALSQAELCQELTWAGLGPLGNLPGQKIKAFEAYGDGKLHIVEVCPDGKTVFRDGSSRPKKLWEGYVEESDELLGLLEQFGHYAPC